MKVVNRVGTETGNPKGGSTGQGDVFGARVGHSQGGYPLIGYGYELLIQNGTLRFGSA